MPQPAPSFRDPMGCCCVFERGVVRVVGAENVAEFDGFLKTRATHDYLAKKSWSPPAALMKLKSRPVMLRPR